MGDADRQTEAWNATWEENRRQKLTRGLAATPAQRLALLEEMILFARRAGALPRQRPRPER